jgi:hypothetical protein
MSELTDDEYTVLAIAAQGEPMMPIGRWKAPALSLVEKGYLSGTPSPQDPQGMFNLRITPAGVKASEESETAMDALFGQLINKSTQIGHLQKKARARAEQIAVQLVDLASLSEQATGEDKKTALEQWARIILTRSLEMIG